ncbi:uncharacterized protein LOC131597939 [Vicia villosa]|uniref:uncharacterized protein LOC131597939 n=1 Tax=Vicia villosa TaxID=3911 RepID=UPI00273B8969|nr:uncharacterized protein LOC131597939 [Vicia villosa]
MSDLRPISLCNVVYKILSKLLANRLKKCLDKCIREEQSTFVEGRSILDNAMIAFEVIHALKRRNSGNNAHLALKIDISKEYDRVDWSFLRGMLCRLGFAERWIHWMMTCVSSVNYSVLVNSDSIGPIQPGRGLRQGDPLSPYLLILVTEALSSLVKGAVARGDIHGVQICRGAPSVENLMEVHNIMEILNLYADVAGQEINLSKSEVFFSRNISISAQKDLANIMGVRHVLGTGTYLGLPSLIGRSKKVIFGYVKDKIWKKINSWRGRPVSKAGKEVMIKSVLQSIPSYVMSLFVLLDGIIHDIEKMLNAFWWSGNCNQSCIKWMAWDKLTGPKSAGDLVSETSRWSIGDGRHIPVMGAPWLRGRTEGILSGPQRQDVYGLSVSDLLSPVGKCWNVPLIREMFDSDAGKAILQVLLIVDVVEDKWNWKEEQNGCYSVRSGYRLWRKEVRSPFQGVAGDWSSLWNIKAPPRVKHLLWRICMYCLPTRVRLQQFHVPCSTVCPFCELYMEDSWHVFFGCDVVNRCWQSAGLAHIVDPRKHNFHDATSLIFDICCKEDSLVAGRVAVMIDTIWKNRNNMIWNNESEAHNILGLHALCNWQDWFKAQTHIAREHTP